MVDRATAIAVGRRYLLAETIEISEENFSRAVRLRRLSPRFRQRLVDLVRAGRLPEEDPPRRAPGCPARSPRGPVLVRQPLGLARRVPWAHCHRFLAAIQLVKAAPYVGREAVYMGEIEAPPEEPSPQMGLGLD